MRSRRCARPIIVANHRPFDMLVIHCRYMQCQGSRCGRGQEEFNTHQARQKPTGSQGSKWLVSGGAGAQGEGTPDLRRRGRTRRVQRDDSNAQTTHQNPPHSPAGSYQRNCVTVLDWERPTITSEQARQMLRYDDVAIGWACGMGSSPAF